jgi:NLR family CARD domain-containing protein 3
MHSSSYQRCIAVLFIFSLLLLQSCRSSSHEVMDESSPDSGTSTPATASTPTTASTPATATAPSSSMAIGPEEWAKYFGEVGDVPPLPADIDSILESQCPFWDDKKVKETHLLVLIPAKVGTDDFTLNLLRKLVEEPSGKGNKTCAQGNEYNLGTQLESKSYWVLMTRDVLPDSRNKPYDAQNELATKHEHYAVPGVLEAATAIFLHHVRTGERLYETGTYMRCQSSEAQNTFTVGYFSSDGLKFGKIGSSSSSISREDIGVSCLRKF